MSTVRYYTFSGNISLILWNGPEIKNLDTIYSLYMYDTFHHFIVSGTDIWRQDFTRSYKYVEDKNDRLQILADSVSQQHIAKICNIRKRIEQYIH